MSEKNLMRNRKQLSDLNLIDDFLFYTILSHKEYGVPFARMILEIILQRKIGAIQIHPQHAIYGSDTEHKGVILDVLIEEVYENSSAPGNSIDLEVDQNKSEEDVNAWPMRARYYHSTIDRKMLKSGDKYDKLRPVYVIIIMNYDPFKKGKLVYTIKRSVVDDATIEYDDKDTTMFLYTRGMPDKNKHQEEIASLLRFVENTDPKNAITSILSKMQDMVTKIKSNEEVSEVFMRAAEREEMLRKEGAAEERAKRLEAEARADEAEKELEKYKKKFGELD